MNEESYDFYIENCGADPSMEYEYDEPNYGMCHFCGESDEDYCFAYKMPLHLIGGRKKKCKRFTEMKIDERS